MKLKFITSISSIFYNLIWENTFLCSISFILIFYGLICLMSGGILCKFMSMFSIENLTCPYIIRTLYH